MRASVFWIGRLLGLAALLGVLAPGLAAKLQVVATTTMVADLARQVGEDAVEVEALMGAGVDPHLYKPTRRDIVALRRADVVLFNGLHLEGRMTDVLRVMEGSGRPVAAIGEAVPEDLRLHPEAFEGHPDPHIWGDPLLWKRTVPAVVEAFAKADPANAAAYRERGQRAEAELDALHAWAQGRVDELPPERRVLITSHDAYNYFGRSFGFEVIGVQGISTVTEAGLADVARLIDYIRDKKIPAIFVESSVSPRTIRRVSEDSGAKVGGELFSDALGTLGDMAEAHGETYDLGTYRGMIKHNVNTIVDALK
ncbi:MAG: zinc ABC transporter substrate-binding protein [Verrucomicrobiota bacterium JB022]|nr:zinc ABC transporter substrate-binding protein [Verrucomicrobiota bacterium JB022]